ncbi:MAG: hypothetical protein JSU63_13710 [Phycisphaerales bacterium]|nr:MAG: hypothetical protein JSU63_13710 [Phycisphaerales bacterium]
MRAGFSCLALALLVLVGSVQGQEIRLLPVASTGDVICMPGTGDCGPTEIILAKGGAGNDVEVTMFMQLDGWDPDDDGIPTLGGFQGAFDKDTFFGVNATPSNPGVNIMWYDEAGLNICGEQVYMSLKVCTSDLSDPIPNVDWLSDCGADAGVCGTFPAGCIDRPDWVYAGMGYTPTISCAGADYTMGAASTDCRDDDDEFPYFYGGTAKVVVPADARSSYSLNFVDDVNFTLYNDCGGVLIPGLNRTPAVITIQTGSCCYGIGSPGAGCTPDLRADECDLLAAPREFRPGVDCSVECCVCLTDFDCNDDNACTDDTCFPECVCNNIPNFVIGTECCDPVTGDLTIIDDGNLCTDDICNPDGTVDHIPNTDPCDDDNGCTVNDACDGGVCVGDDVNDFPCVDDSDCVFTEGSWPCVDLFCECLLATPLVINVDPGEYPDANCFDVGDEITMQVTMLAGSEEINGGQFLLTYDDECLELIDVGPCDGSIFDKTPAVSYWGGGSIFYVTHVEPYEVEVEPGVFEFITGTKGPADMACLTFVKLDGCDACNVCFDGVNPENTFLTNSEGNLVDYTTACSKDVRLNGTLSMDDMGDVDVNADCGMPTANIVWDTPTADDTCGEADIVCTGAFAHNVGEPAPDQAIVDALVMNGGVFTQGQWYFQCTATNDCGDTMQEVWTVMVSDKHSLDVEVHVGGLVPGNVERCICFELYDEACNAPVIECTEMYFGPPYNFRGHADGFLKIEKYNWECIAAVDPYHTLRAEGELACVDNVWKATWKGDPLLGGNWLIPGNLDYWKGTANTPNVIDVVDFSQFIVSVQGGGVMSADTTCGMPGPHGDINGDGVVDNIDYGIIEANFLASAKDVCCVDVPGAFDAPVTSISVKDLRARGLGELTSADLNGDGWVDADDMLAYQQGVSVKKVRSTR